MLLYCRKFSSTLKILLRSLSYHPPSKPSLSHSVNSRTIISCLHFLCKYFTSNTHAHSSEELEGHIDDHKRSAELLELQETLSWPSVLNLDTEDYKPEVGGGWSPSLLSYGNTTCLLIPPVSVQAHRQSTV